MPALTTLKPHLWNVQQGYIAREWRDLWDNLVWAALPGGPWRHDLISGGMGTLLTSGNWRGVSKHGLALESTSTSNGGASWPWSDRLLTITTQCTIVVWALPTSLAASAKMLSVPYANGTWVDPFASLLFARDTTTANMFIGRTTGGILDILSSATGMIQVGDALTMYAVTQVGTSVVFYRNGAQHSTGSLTGGASTLDWGAKQPITLFNRSSSSTGEGMSARTPLALIFNRALTNGEIKRLYLNPYGMFALRMPYEVLPVFYEQEGFRFRNDDGSETTATWRQAQDTDDSIARETPFRLRMNVNTTRDPANQNYKEQYRPAAGGYDWEDVEKQ